MPVIHLDILCVTEPELTQCGVSATYLQAVRAKQRAGKVYCWEHHKEGNAYYYHYHSLRPVYQTLVRTAICGGAEPEVYIANMAQRQTDAVTEQIASLVQTDPDELNTLLACRLVSPTEAHQLARAAAWLRIINEYDAKSVRRLGFSSITAFRDGVFKHCLNEQNSNLIRFKKGAITNERVLYVNAVKYRDNGIQCLIHGGNGNVNRQKTDTLAHAKLMELASAQVKYSWEDIGLMYNDWAELNERKNLTVEAIKAHLYKPAFKKVWYYMRHGKLAADNEIQPLINRNAPSFPDALWSLDGSTVQLYYVDDKGAIRSDLYVYFVTDACTGAIIGYSIAYAETAELVEQALRLAIFTHGNKPYQLQYDNSSANVAYVTRNLMDNMARVSFPCEPYKGRSKYVESVIGHFQQRVLRKRENFKGGNITTRSLNSKANPELLAQLKKDSSRLPSVGEVIDEFKQAVGEWNGRGESRDSFGRFTGPSKLARYSSIQHEKRAKISYFEQIRLFFIEQKDPYTYEANGIAMTIKGKKYHFAVHDPDGIGDFIFSAENFGLKFNVRLDRENTHFITLYRDGKYIADAVDKEYYASAVADLKEGEKANLYRFKQKQDENGYDYAVAEMARQMEVLGENKATGTDGFGWWDTSKASNNARESASEDARNGISDGLSDRQRKILNIGK